MEARVRSIILEKASQQSNRNGFPGQILTETNNLIVKQNKKNFILK